MAIKALIAVLQNVQITAVYTRVLTLQGAAIESISCHQNDQITAVFCKRLGAERATNRLLVINMGDQNIQNRCSLYKGFVMSSSGMESMPKMIKSLQFFANVWGLNDLKEHKIDAA